MLVITKQKVRGMRAADLLFRCRDDILLCEKLASVYGENVFLPLIIW